VTVRPDGRISTSLLSGIVARGKTVPELQEILFSQYQSDAKGLGFPEVGRLTVVVKTVSPLRIFVGGEVTTPGEIVSDIHDLTLAGALFRAGGVKPSGDEDKIFIIRNGPDGSPQYYMTSYHDVVTGKKSGANVPLAPYDIVIVPRSGITNVYLAFNKYVQQFVPISWGFSYIANEQYGATNVTAPAASTGH
jgi:polysaccharide export outer membrane protein